MNTISTVCVYCASSDKCDPIHLQSAYDLGAILAKQGIDIVYGGGNSGLMGKLADGAIAFGGHVTGIIPVFMQNLEWGHKSISVLEEVKDIHTRKLQLIKRSDAIIALPGGCGTLEELLEAITWKRLGLTHQPIIIVNTNGFYDPLIAMLDKIVQEKFMREEHRLIWHTVPSIQDALPAILNASLWPKDAIDYAKV